MDLETIENELLNLPLTERAKLAHGMLDSTTPNQLDEIWLAEAELRANALDDGLATCVPAEEILRKAHALLK